MARICANCGKEMGPSDTFCLNCGSMFLGEGSTSGRDPYVTQVAHVQTDDSYTVQTSSAPVDGSTTPLESIQTTAPGFCTECGFKYKPGWSYCMACGSPLAIWNQAGRKSVDIVKQSNSTIKVKTERPDLSAFVSPDAPVMPYVTDLRNDNDFFPEEPDGDDSATMIYGGESDMDAPTMVYMPEKRTYRLLRSRTGECFRLNLPATIGKGSAATVRISGSKIISRVHAKLYERDSHLFIEDNQSTNKTYVNGVALLPGAAQPLGNGDVVKLADEEFIVSME